MRAAIISPHHQNMIIRNPYGEIIGKSTIYVNREQGYAVFNNVESSFKHRTEEELQAIYDAFMRGAEILMQTYNTNNPTEPLKVITIGCKSNTIISILTKNNPNHKVLYAPPYGNWSFNGYGNYIGDAHIEQRLVLALK
jgi:hypothetical protein